MAAGEHAARRRTGRSASENECRLRRKCRCTTQASATTQPTAIAHHGRCGSASGAVAVGRTRSRAPRRARRATAPYSGDGGDRRPALLFARATAESLVAHGPASTRLSLAAARSGRASSIRPEIHPETGTQRGSRLPARVRNFTFRAVGLRYRPARSREVPSPRTASRPSNERRILAILGVLAASRARRPAQAAPASHAHRPAARRGVARRGRARSSAPRAAEVTGTLPIIHGVAVRLSPSARGRLAHDATDRRSANAVSVNARTMASARMSSGSGHRPGSTPPASRRPTRTRCSHRRAGSRRPGRASASR